MKYYYTLIMYFIFYSSIAQVTFQKRFGHSQNNVAENVFDATLDSNGNLYIVGVNNLETFNITKVDSFGQTLWMKTLSSINIEPNRVIFSSDSSIIILGRGSITSSDNYIFLTKTDTAGNIIWSRFISTDGRFNIAKFLFEDNVGNFIIGGYQNVEFDSVQLAYKNNPFIAKFDPGGNLSWFKQIQGIYTLGFNDGIALSNGNYTMTGFVGDTIFGEKDILLLETDSSGAIQRSVAIGNTTLDLGQKVVEIDQKVLIAANDNNLSILATPHFIELDSSWNIILNKKPLTGGGSTYDVSHYLNGSYLVSSSGPMLYVIDTNLTIIEGKNYGNSGFNRRIYKSFSIGEGRVFSCGTNGDVSDILVLRTDSVLDSGCNSFSTNLFSDTIPPLSMSTLNLIVSDTIFNISSFDSLQSHSWSELELCNNYTGLNDLNSNVTSGIVAYPNPSTGVINLQIDSNFVSKSILIEILDFQGRVFANFQRDVYPNYTILLDLYFLSDGHYIIKILSNEKWCYFKINIIR